jgi:hypothetical protein
MVGIGGFVPILHWVTAVLAPPVDIYSKNRYIYFRISDRIRCLDGSIVWHIYIYIVLIEREISTTNTTIHRHNSVMCMYIGWIQ